MVRRMEFRVEDSGHGRLDRYLLDRLPGESRASIQRLIAGGHVRLEGRVLKASTKVRPGDRLRVEIPEPVATGITPEAIPLNIVHQEASFMVISKPSGMVVHPGAGRRTGTLVNALLALEGGFSGIGGALRPGIVHRLDRETSGLLIVARTDPAHRNLSAQLARREVKKIYLTLVWGHPVPSRGRIEAPVGRHPVSRTRMAVRTSGGRLAVTDYETLERIGGFALLRVRIHTGRTHQIRVHLKHRGHPVVGDRDYGGRRFSSLSNPAMERLLASFDRLALHAHSLEFHHPESGEPLAFESPLPREFLTLLEEMRKLH